MHRARRVLRLPALVGWILLQALAGVPPLAAGVDSWSYVGPDGGIIRALAIDSARPDSVYALTDGAGLWKSLDRGGRWVRLGGVPASGLSALAVSASRPATVYVASGYGPIYSLFRSRDAGATWDRPGEPAASLSLSLLAVAPEDPDEVWASGGSAELGAGIMRSLDGGETWRLMVAAGTFRGATSLVLDALNPQTVYVAGLDGVFKSTDSGESWREVNTVAQGPPLRNVVGLVASPADPSILYVSTGELLLRSEGGEVWQQQARLPGGCGWLLAASPAEPQAVFAGCALGVVVTRDGGVTWSEAGRGLPGGGVRGGQTLALAIDPVHAEVLYAGMAGQGVYRSVDGGRRWRRATRGLSGATVLTLAFAPQDPAVLYADVRGTVDGDGCHGLHRTSDYGRSWAEVSSGLGCLTTQEQSSEPLALAVALGGAIYLGADQGLFERRDHGLTWRQLSNHGTSGLALDPTRPQLLFRGGYGVFRSTDGGQSWVEVLSGTAGPQPRRVLGLLIDPVDPDTLYAMARIGSLGGGSLASDRTADRGSSWIEIDPPLPALELAPSEASVLYSGSGWRSTDGGLTWQETGFPGDSGRSLVVVPGDPPTLYALGDSSTGIRLFRSHDGGATWQGLQSLTGFGPWGARGAHPQAPERLYCWGTVLAEAQALDAPPPLSGRWPVRGARSLPDLSGALRAGKRPVLGGQRRGSPLAGLAGGGGEDRGRPVGRGSILGFRRWPLELRVHRDRDRP